jgi:hypothetical protein
MAGAPGSAKPVKRAPPPARRCVVVAAAAPRFVVVGGGLAARPWLRVAVARRVVGGMGGAAGPSPVGKE